MFKKWYVCVLVLMVVCGCVRAAEDVQSLGEQCAPKLTAVMTCVAFATGKEATPQQKCCDSIKEMKESNPACLCFLIQQIHNGTNPTLQKLNIQESRLLQLSSACKIANASITDCPRLLKLPSNSPDAALFNNNATILPPTSGGMPSSTSTNSPVRSNALKCHAPAFAKSILIFVAFLLTVSSTSIFGA
ncbi:unnamed protein product [Lactuca virosa]|uniref:Bifunctional inhibitor/plant lipid transfer protein/seed storage helical domain-containing protein n=1 Tax=Lactuca virosa TaxID=75947 RepID=A0AAU9NB18_9ASTR|nr:unnamed protein product [Lactuca virosa]